MRKLKKIENFYWIIPSLLAFTIPYDTNYSNISFIFLAIFFIVFFSYVEFKKALQNKFWGVLCLNVVIFLLGLLFINQGAPRPNYDILGKYLLLAAIPVLLYKNLTPDNQKRILLSFCVGIILGMLCCFISHYGSMEASEPITYSNFTVPMGGIHPPYLSQFIVFAFFILLEFFFKQLLLWRKIVIIFLLFSMFYGMIFLQARMPILAFIGCLLLYLIFKTYNSKKTKYLKFSIFFISVAGMLFLLIVDADDFYFIKARFLENSTQALDIRFNTWDCAIQVFMENSKLLGVGFSNTQSKLDACYKSHYFARPFFEHYNAHNQYLQILVTSGVLGLLVWLITLGVALLKVFKERNILGMIFLVLFIICSFTEVFLARIWGVLYFALFYTLFVIKNYKIN